MFQLYNDRQGQWRWRFIAANNRILADSGESYYNRADCEHAINLIRQLAPVARTV
jgi:uncharacterized protein YegP (UPF0339 family)